MAEDSGSMAPAAEDVCLLVIDFDASRLAQVRAEVSRQLRAVGVSATRAEEFLVAVSEAMTNAIRHGAGGGRIRLWRDGRVVCEVADDGAGFPAGPPRQPIPPPRVGSTGGRGLWLSQELTDSMEIATGPDGTRVRLATHRAADEAANGSSPNGAHPNGGKPERPAETEPDRTDR